MNALQVVAGVLNGSLEKAQAVLDALAANRYEVVELPEVASDEWGDRVITVPVGIEPHERGKIRMGQGKSRDKIEITGLPSTLRVEYAAPFGGALIASGRTPGAVL